MRPFRLFQAASLRSALDTLGGAATLAKAGGIDVLDLLKERLIRPELLVDLRGLAELATITVDTQGARLGPLCTLAQLAQDAPLARGYRALVQAAADAASPQIRNVATLGGNLCQRPRCWYFRSLDFQCLKKGGTLCFAQQGDTTHHAIFDNEICAIVHPSSLAVALVALDARLVLRDRRTKRTVTAESFFAGPRADVQRENVLRPGELIASIELPPPPAGARTSYVKIKQQQSFDWPLAELALQLVVRGGKVASLRLVLGAAAAVPYRALRIEKALVGQTVDEARVRKAVRTELALARPLPHNRHKLELFETLIGRALGAASAEG